MRRLTPYLLLSVLVLGTGLGIGLGLSEAPSSLPSGPVPPDPTGVRSAWLGPSLQAGSAPGDVAKPLAVDIDEAPVVRPGTYDCPANFDFYHVVLMFEYPNGRPITADVVLTGCDWVRVGTLMKPSADPGRGPHAARWVTAKLRADLIALGAPQWAHRRTTLPPATTVPPTSTPYVAASARCQVAQLSLGEGAPISPATGQHPILLTLTNEGSTACYLFGYPGISLYDTQGHLLPLTYQWAGDQMVTSAPPSRVGLVPGGIAYVLINKYRCDLGDLDVAATLSFTPPDDISPLTLNLQGLGSEESCVPGADGVTLAISPVEASVQATLQG